MDIYSDDLAPADIARIQQIRILAGPGGGNGSFAFLGAVFGLPLGVVASIWLHIIPDAFGPDGLGGFENYVIVTGAGAVLGGLIGFVADRTGFSKQRPKPITMIEIGAIRKDETDPLRLEYLSLLSALVSGQSAKEASEAASIRAAVRDISLGIAALPGQPPGDLLLDAGTLNREAARLGVEAAGEQDPVIAASLHRQAQARRQRSEAVGRSAALARRNDTLRREMLEHVRALKTLCGAAALEDGGGNYDMTALVENIKQVASEAKSLVEARQELAAALPQPELATVALTNAN